VQAPGHSGASAGCWEGRRRKKRHFQHVSYAQLTQPITTVPAPPRKSRSAPPLPTHTTPSHHAHHALTLSPTLLPPAQALVDFLVLINSRAFVGLGSSTFSVYTREHRVMRGHKREDDVFVDTSKIGTDALFERTTHFSRLDLDPTAMFNRWK
jgi:hypothetical protein